MSVVLISLIDLMIIKYAKKWLAGKFRKSREAANKQFVSWFSFCLSFEHIFISILNFNKWVCNKDANQQTLQHFVLTKLATMQQHKGKHLFPLVCHISKCIHRTAYLYVKLTQLMLWLNQSSENLRGKPPNSIRFRSLRYRVTPLNKQKLTRKTYFDRNSSFVPQEAKISY